MRRSLITGTIMACLIHAGAIFAADCEGLAKIKLPNTTITLAQTVAAGAFTPPIQEPAFFGGPSFKDLPSFCRVTGSIKPTPQSDIRFEVWMPVSGWNGKFQGIGNGGFAGSIIYASGLANALANGYATASTDTGHQQDGLAAGWAKGNPERVIDYGYRGIHETAEKSKAIVKAYYGRAPERAYFNSCSNGGRQALMEAQRYPGDYDGIIAGAPANNFTRVFAGFIWNMQAASGPGYISAAKLPAIEKAALAACDARDGVADGVIDNPVACRFDPAALQCKGPESDACLTAPQVRTLARIYSGPLDAKNKPLFPGFPPGGETGLFGWTWIVGPGPGRSLQTIFATQFFTNFLAADPDWDLQKFDLETGLKAVEGKLGHVLNANDPNLKAFRDRGGKLVIYHGWSDAAIAPESSIHYYRGVVEKLGQGQTDSFVRLFMAPGLQHCFGGPGPNNFGNLAGPMGDADHDINAALERWVEKGAAPQRIIAAKYKNDLNPKSGLARSRPLCPYPQVAKYNGSGSSDDAANFVCSK